MDAPARGNCPAGPGTCRTVAELGGQIGLRGVCELQPLARKAQSESLRRRNHGRQWTPGLAPGPHVAGHTSGGVAEHHASAIAAVDAALAYSPHHITSPTNHYASIAIGIVATKTATSAAELGTSAEER